jgi:uncharacterized protein
LKASEIGLDKKYHLTFKKIRADVSLQKSSIGIRADFSIIYSAEFSCVRCLGAYSRDGDVELHLDYVEGEDPHLKNENVELTAHDADKVYYRGPQIDLAIGIREAIILSLPIMQLCRDDCRGLCPVCGINLNAGSCSCKTEKVGAFTPQKLSGVGRPAKKVRKKRAKKK